MQSDMKALSQLKPVSHWRRPAGRVAVATILLVITMLACVGIRPVSQSGPRRIVIATHLPTLTRTPLSTLTPTANGTPVVVAFSTESTASVSELTPSPVKSKGPVALVSPVAPGAEPFLPDHSANGAPAAGVEPVTDPNALVEAETTPPTSSPTPAVMATATLIPPTDTPTPVPLPTETPLPTSTPTETPIPLPAGWVFSGVRPVSISGGRYLMVPGILFNNTGTTQTLNEIRQIFPGDPELSSASNSRAYYPIPQVPQGGWIPFKLLIPDPDAAGDFELEAVGNEGGDGPRQQFEFLDVNVVMEQDKYCVAGKVRNSGDPLNAYLVVAAVLYDGEDKVINYDDYDAESPQFMAGDQKEVNICVDSLGQEVARYELQAWGL